jgi:hypothetical protein
LGYVPVIGEQISSFGKFADAAKSFSTELDPARLTRLNGCFGEKRCTAKKSSPRLRANAASAIAAPAQGRFVRRLCENSPFYPK